MVRIILWFWVRIPEGPPGFSTGQAICLACFLFHGSSFHLRIACLLTSGRPRSAARDAAATEPAHLLRLSPTHRPYPVFRENRRPSTCDFIFVRGARVGGCRPNVVDRPVSWREAPGAGGVEPDGRAAAAPPSRGAGASPGRLVPCGTSYPTGLSSAAPVSWRCLYA